MITTLILCTSLIIAAPADSQSDAKPSAKSQPPQQSQAASAGEADSDTNQNTASEEGAEVSGEKEPDNVTNFDLEDLESLELEQIEKNIIELTNRERVKHGLKPLQVDPRLMKSARRHCTWMTRTKQMVHTQDNVGENIAMGQRSSSEAVRSWMNSSGHRKNILSTRYRRIGAAAYRTPQGRIFWCEQFFF